MLSLKKILCPTDFSEPSQEAIKAGQEVASHFGAEVVLVHVVPPVSLPPVATIVPPATVPLNEEELEASARQSLEEWTGRLQAQGLQARFTILRGDPADEIVRAAEREDAGLIVIATHGRTGLDRLIFGSVAGKVVRLANCPVLTGSFRLSNEAAREAVLPPREEGGLPERSEKQEEGGKPAEKSDKQKEEEEQIEARLKHWESRMEKLRAGAEKARSEWTGEEIRTEMLRGKLETLRRTLEDRYRTGDETWEEVKARVEAGLDELQETFGATSPQQKRAETTKAAEKIEKYVQKREAQLREWGAKIDALKSKAESSREEVRTKYLAQVEDLRRKQETAKKKLQDLRHSGSQAWEDLKTGLDQVLEEMKKSMKQAVSRFREK